MVICNFQFDKGSDEKFYAGEEIKGRVEIISKSPITARSIVLKLSGKAFCKFEDDDEIMPQLLPYFGKDKLMRSETHLFGLTSSPPQEISAGTHRYDFKCLIPDSVPGSFEGKYGHIRFYVKVKIEVPRRLNKKFKQRINVARKENLNAYPTFRFPRHTEQTKKFSSNDYESLMMRVDLPRTAFIVGDSIPVTITYKNRSKKKVLETKISLVQVITYNVFGNDVSPKNSKIERIKIFKKKCEGAEEISDVIRKVSLDLPVDLNTTNVNFCRRVQVSYELKVEAKLSGWNSDFETSFPVFVGTVPFEAIEDDGEEISADEENVGNGDQLLLDF